MPMPSKYREEFADQAHKLCLLLGATNERLARFFEVSDTTIDTWIAKHDEFRDAVHSAKDIADAEVAVSLFHRAKGYSHPETKVHFYEDKDGKVQVKTVDVIKHYPPDTGAGAFWMKNRQGWRDKVELTGSGQGGALELIVVYEDEDPPQIDEPNSESGEDTDRI
jgi:hypothetical protein